jgi:hypothetical protein
VRKQGIAWVSIFLAVTAFGGLVAFGASGGAVAFLAILATLTFGAIGWAMRTEVDAHWLPKWVVIGFLAKLLGTFGRHYMVAVLYGGGDSYRYFRVGTELAAEWRAGRVPELTEQGAFGTQVVEAITGGLFALFPPDLLGGFLIFSIFAFLGQLMLYAAYRRWARPHQLKPYAVLIFLLPTYAFWPSSIGKDALVVFAIGGAAYFTSRALKAYELRWLGGLAAFLTILGLIRIHIAGLLVIGLIGATIFARMPAGTTSLARTRRLLTLGAFAAAGAVVLTVFPDIFGVEITGGDSLDAFTADVVRRTSEKGTVAAGGPVSGIGDIPGAIALVLFRPYIFEATEIQHYFAALETTVILGLTLWKLPALLRNRREWRRNGYLVFSTVYVVGFAVAFSVVRNLGIIARQRGQVLALFLAVIIGLGWEEKEERFPAPVTTPVRSALGASPSLRPTEHPQPERR